jgi:hypothetical protein
LFLRAIVVLLSRVSGYTITIDKGLQTFIPSIFLTSCRSRNPLSIDLVDNTNSRRTKMIWSNMESLQYRNQTTNSETQITYHYACETSLMDGEKTLANIERWSSRGSKHWSSSSIYRVWIWLNGSPKLYGELKDTTLKECKEMVVKYLLNNTPRKENQ